jgi:hypothetical protein
MSYFGVYSITGGVPKQRGKSQTTRSLFSGINTTCDESHDAHSSPSINIIAH